MRAWIAFPLIAGCFSPTYPVGLTCGTDEPRCPPGQTCQDDRCEVDPTPSDAPTDDGAVLDAAPGTWVRESSGIGNADLFGIWGTGANDLWAVGGGGHVLRRQNGVWDDYTAFTQNTLRDLSGTASNDIWAVGDAGAVFHWDGNLWMAKPHQAFDYDAVWANTPNDVWLAGAPGKAAHWASSTWTSHDIAAAVPAPVRAIYGRFDLAYAAAGTKLHEYTTVWTQNNIATPTGSEDIWGSGGSVWVVGRAGEIYYKNGVTQYVFSKPTNADLFGIDGTGPDDVWAVGVNVILHYTALDGWVPEAKPPIASLNAVRAVSPTQVWAVGDDGAIYRRVF